MTLYFNYSNSILFFDILWFVQSIWCYSRVYITHTSSHCWCVLKDSKRFLSCSVIVCLLCYIVLNLCRWIFFSLRAVQRVVSTAVRSAVSSAVRRFREIEREQVCVRCAGCKRQSHSWITRYEVLLEQDKTK